jgi:hypothetical protein
MRREHLHAIQNAPRVTSKVDVGYYYFSDVRWSLGVLHVVIYPLDELATELGVRAVLHIDFVQNAIEPFSAVDFDREFRGGGGAWWHASCVVRNSWLLHQAGKEKKKMIRNGERVEK